MRKKDNIDFPLPYDEVIIKNDEFIEKIDIEEQTEHCISSDIESLKEVFEKNDLTWNNIKKSIELLKSYAIINCGKTVLFLESFKDELFSSLKDKKSKIDHFFLKKNK